MKHLHYVTPIQRKWKITGSHHFHGNCATGSETMPHVKKCAGPKLYAHKQHALTPSIVNCHSGSNHTFSQLPFRFKSHIQPTAIPAQMTHSGKFHSGSNDTVCPLPFWLRRHVQPNAILVQMTHSVNFHSGLHDTFLSKKRTKLAPYNLSQPEHISELFKHIVRHSDMCISSMQNCPISHIWYGKSVKAE